MTVQRLRDEMEEREFTQWRTYYQRIAQRQELAAQRAKMSRGGSRGRS